MEEFESFSGKNPECTHDICQNFYATDDLRHVSIINYTISRTSYLLAATGALIVMMCYYEHISAAATFSDFHSAHQCN